MGHEFWASVTHNILWNVEIPEYMEKGDLCYTECSDMENWSVTYMMAVLL